jgi:very-short-patch-repair endonuclease
VPPANAQDLAALAAEQDGVFSRAQARQAGFSFDRIGRRIASGEWVELYGGQSLRSAHTILDARGRDRAALIATGARSMLGGPSAARWWSIEVPWPRPFILVPSTSRRERAGITIRRGPIDDHDIVLRDGLLLTSRPCTLVDCLRVVPFRMGVALLDRALQQNWLTFDDLVHRTQQLVARPGVATLVRHIRVAGPGTRSEGERKLASLLRRAGLVGWLANFPLDGVGVLDFAFAGQRVAIEIDGRAWHSSGNRFQSDRSRQNRLVLLGWTVLRFTWDDLVHRPDDVIRQVRQALRDTAT